MMAGLRERARMPYETDKQEKFAYGLKPRKFKDYREGRGRAVTDEEWAQFPEMEEYRDQEFVWDLDGVMLPDPETGELRPFQELIDVEMGEEQLAAFEELFDRASHGEGPIAAEDGGFYQKLLGILKSIE